MTRSLRPLAASIALFALGLHVPAMAQQRQPTPQPKVQVPAPETLHPALWKVSDADTTIYLFGTIHALPKGLIWLDGPIANALDRSSALITEVPELDPVAVQANVLRRALLPPGKTLRALLTPREQRKLAAALKAAKLPPAAFDRYKPWYAAIVLGSLPLAANGYVKTEGVEEQLAAWAKAHGVARRGLETFDYQLGIFDSLPLASQRAFLMGVIDESATIGGDLTALVREWGQGHPDRLAKMLNEQPDEPAMTKALIETRNRTWAAWIKARLDQPGTVFVAVGAGHLAGKGSVQDDLAAAGIAVVRVQ
jgi:uncharacterized protein